MQNPYSLQNVSRTETNGDTATIYLADGAVAINVRAYDDERHASIMTLDDRGNYDERCRVAHLRRYGEQVTEVSGWSYSHLTADGARQLSAILELAAEVTDRLAAGEALA